MQWSFADHPILGISLGPCAWRVTMLPVHGDYVHAHRSLVVAMPEDDLATASSCLGRLPVMLVVSEPAFARQLPALIEERMRQLNRDRVDILALSVADTAELKSGGMLQTLFALRDAGRASNIGLATDHVQSAEWLAMNVAARALILPWSAADQVARYRAIPAARDYGLTCLSLAQPDDDRAFLLAASDWVTPILDRPLPDGLHPLGAADLEVRWNNYCASHPPPPPLPRSRPPEE